jgi:hypothetical protein
MCVSPDWHRHAPFVAAGVTAHGQVDLQVLDRRAGAERKRQPLVAFRAFHRERPILVWLAHDSSLPPSIYPTNPDHHLDRAT